VRLGLASPEEIRSWSHGEVTESETINYRTHKPERGGLYAEEIFGPEKDYECACGKYRGRKYEGIKCEKCGVLVTTRDVRRSWMGHIELASPVVHFWYLKGISSPLSTLLGIKKNVLRKIAYYETEPLHEDVYLVTRSSEKDIAVSERLYGSQLEILQGAKKFEAEPAYVVVSAPEVRAKAAGQVAFEERELSNGQIMRLVRIGDQEHWITPGAQLEVKQGSHVEEGELLAISPVGPDELISETQYHFLQEVYPDLQAQRARETVDSLIYLVTNVKDPSLPFRVGDRLWEPQIKAYERLYPRQFEVGAGAEGIQGVLANLDLEAWSKELKAQIEAETSEGRKKRLLKRLEVVEQLRKSGNRPQDMVLTVIPVLPPDLRPIVQLEGGKFATTDLNDLYRRIINRNNRLKKLREMGAPEIILRNEKRMLQEAVDALIHNEKKDSPILGRDNRPLKSLSERIAGKQGRLRRNLLGKRVDYSGRAVIVVNPKLKLHQCGVPKQMALELFKPFILRELSERDVHHISNYDEVKNKALSGEMPEVWDILEELIQEHPVLLNRAPTLHRLGIQAFEPILVDGEAIQIHPFVCPPYNADFDGDQMAIHLPLLPEAIQESRELMLSSKNILSPAHGGPLSMPTKDFVFAYYYLTMEDPNGKGAGKAFSSLREAERAYEEGVISLHAPIKIRIDGQIFDTTLGRARFNQYLPKELRDYSRAFDGGDVEKLVMQCYHRFGMERTVELLDQLKDLALEVMTQSGLTIAVTDALIPPEKSTILEEAQERVDEIERKYQRGLATAEERREAIVKIWMEAVDRMEKATMAHLAKHRFNPLYMIVNSKARGSANQVKQLAGMRGPMSDPTGRILETPVKSNFREGLTVFEYFISTHGGRKGTADTALKTAESGYLTRRLYDATEELIVKEEDCGTQAGVEIHPLRYDSGDVMETLEERIYGRYTAEPVRFDGEVLLERDQLIDREWAAKLGNLVKTLPTSDKRFMERVVGTVSVEAVRDPKTNTVIVAQDELITRHLAEKLKKSKVKAVTVRPRIVVRSPMTCEVRRGVCQKCYGLDLSVHEPVELGTAVGVIAAQSIGEPGTQLTMRTFHTGGVVGEDITQGLPRAEELFEARKTLKSPEGEIAEISGVVTDISRTEEGREVVHIRGDEKSVRVPKALVAVKPGDEVSPTGIITSKSPVGGIVHLLESDEGRWLVIAGEDDRVYVLPPDVRPVVKTGDWVEEGQALSEPYNEEPIVAQRDGTVVELRENGRVIVVEDSEGHQLEHRLPYGARRKVEVGDKVTRGMQLSTRSIPITIKAEQAGMAVMGRDRVVVYTPDPNVPRAFPLTEDITVLKEDGAAVKPGELLFALNLPAHGTCVIDGIEELEDGLVEIQLHYELSVVLSNPAIVKVGDKVREGDLLSKGVTSPQLLLKVAGVAKTRDYLLTEIHKVYKSQGVDINDKHIELVIRQMVNNVRVDDPGDSGFFPNQLVVLEEFREELKRLQEENREIRRQRESLIGQVLGEDLMISPAEGGEETNGSEEVLARRGDEITRQLIQKALEAGVEALPLDRGEGRIEWVRIKEKRLPVGERVLLRISKAALETKPWLSAASFQRTTTVLAESALRGAVDPLEDLKSNVIIGRLIPAGTGFWARRQPPETEDEGENGAESTASGAARDEETATA
jgi:DNA-directed RNA polymerase subunit beta'